MPVDCPNCHGPISRFRLFRTTAFGRWRCKHCDALLAVDTRRRMLGILAAILLPLAMIIPLEMGILPARSAVVLPFTILGTILIVLALDRPLLIQRAGFRCRSCGYDLRGQVVPRCPECGTELDEEQQALLADENRPAYMTVPGAQLRRRRYMAAILILVGLMLAGGVLAGVFARRQRAAAARRAATQPSTSNTASSVTPTASPATTQPSP